MAKDESAAGDLFLDWAFIHDNHGCSLRYLVGFGDKAQDRLDAALDEWRSREGASVQTVEHDVATEYVFVTQGDTVGRGGRWDHLAEARWGDPLGSNCSMSTLESAQWGEDLSGDTAEKPQSHRRARGSKPEDHLETMAEHLQMPFHQVLRSLLPDSIGEEALVDLEMTSLKKAGSPEAPGLDAKYGRSMGISAVYGDAAGQFFQLLIRRIPGRVPPVRTVSQADRTFYVAGENRKK